MKRKKEVENMEFSMVDAMYIDKILQQKGIERGLRMFSPDFRIFTKEQLEQIDEFKKLEIKKLDVNIDYEQIKGLSLEARQKLNKQKPLSVGQASRISGVSPADISVLLIYLSQNK